jgi:hypothetical protein
MDDDLMYEYCKMLDQLDNVSCYEDREEKEIEELIGGDAYESRTVIC